MKVFRSFLWLIVVLLALQVIRVFFSRQASIAAFQVVLILGCFQFLLVQGVVFVWLVSWALRRYFHFRRPVRHALLSLGLCVVLLECLLAWWMYHPERLPSPLRVSYGYYYDYFQEDLLQFDKRYAVYDSDLFYTLKPDAVFTFENIEFKNAYQTNHFGFRDTVRSSPQVVCIGDSYTMGWGVEQGEAFPSKLAELSGLRVANMGMASYGTARELMSLSKVDTSHLQWLIIQYCGNDQGENTSCIEHRYKLQISSPSSYEDLIHAAEVSRIYFPGKYLLIIGSFFEKGLLNRIYPVFNLRWERKDWGRGQEQQAKAFLDILYHSPINFRKVKVIVTMMDDHQNMQGVFLSTVRKMSAEAPYREKFGGELKVVDMAPLLSKDDLFILDVHFKASGHTKIARALLSAMNAAP